MCGGWRSSAGREDSLRAGLPESDIQGLRSQPASPSKYANRIKPLLIELLIFMNQKIKTLLIQATEMKEAKDHCTGQSNTWTEINHETFARLIVEQCIGLIEQDSQRDAQAASRAKALADTLRKHFGF
jgi:hypothetical protein